MLYPIKIAICRKTNAMITEVLAHETSGQDELSPPLLATFFTSS